MDLSNISTSEWEIMRVVWTQKQTTSKEIYELLGSAKNWQPSTIKTLLKRLVEKNMLEVSKSANKYIYKALVSEDNSIEYIACEMISKVCSTNIVDVLEIVIKNSQFTTNDITVLKEVLSKKQCVEKVECNCLPGQCNCK